MLDLRIYDLYDLSKALLDRNIDYDLHLDSQDLDDVYERYCFLTDAMTAYEREHLTGAVTVYDKYGDLLLLAVCEDAAPYTQSAGYEVIHCAL